MENEVKLILESLVSEPFCTRIQTNPFWGNELVLIGKKFRSRSQFWRKSLKVTCDFEM